MKSEEIKKLLELRDYLLEVKEFYMMLSTSPQIYHTHYNEKSDVFENFTDDGYHFQYRVYHEEDKTK